MAGGLETKKTRGKRKKMIKKLSKKGGEMIKQRDGREKEKKHRFEQREEGKNTRERIKNKQDTSN